MHTVCDNMPLGDTFSLPERRGWEYWEGARVAPPNLHLKLTVAWVYYAAHLVTERLSRGDTSSYSSVSLMKVFCTQEPGEEGGSERS